MTLHIEQTKQIVLSNGQIFNCSKIDRVGIEFEGLFFEVPNFKGSFKGDGSVCGFSQRGSEGEFVSEAIQPNEVSEFVQKTHPSGTRGTSNASCGGHVHISVLSRADYMTLLTEKFYDHFMKKWNEFGHNNEVNEGTAFWNRINARSVGDYNPRFCKSGFRGIEQSKSKYYYVEDRYHFINYCFNVEHDNPRKCTLEFRVPPMFQSKSLQTKAILEIMKIVQEYLEANPPQKPITLRLKI